MTSTEAGEQFDRQAAKYAVSEAMASWCGRIEIFFGITQHY